MMNSKNSRASLMVVLSIIVAGAFFRFIPHWPNFTPVAAMALFGGAYLGRRHLAFIIPIGAMFLSDLVLGLHADIWAVYLAFGITVVIGSLIRNNPRVFNIIGASLASSLIFFLLTNFAAWLSSPFYPDTFSGLMQSYIAGLAFFNNGSLGVSFFVNELAGGLFYSGVFFGAYALARRLMPSRTSVV
jgi:hypothetical protein